MIRLFLAAARLDQVGPFLLGALAFVGAFSRGGANTVYSLMILWGLILWVLAALNRRSPHVGWPPLPPARWMVGLAVFALTWLVAALAGDHPVAGLKALASQLYPLVLPFLVWPIFSRRPDFPAQLRFLWGLGLVVAAALTFREGGYQLVCLRAKAYLGTIELGSILGQLIPLMVAALLYALSVGRRRETAFFALALVAAGLALTQNCSRQTLLAAPAISLLMFWAYWRHFNGKPWRRFLILIPVLTLALVTILPLTVGGDQRFLNTLKLEFGAGSEPASVILSESETLRVDMWRLGWKTFMQHPLLGRGLGDSFDLALQSGEVETVLHTHHVFINVLAETGLLGFLGFLALHLAPLSLLWPHRRSRDPETFFWVWAALAVNLQLVLNGLTDQVFGIKTIMYIHWIVMAAALWQTQRPQKNMPE